MAADPTHDRLNDPDWVGDGASPATASAPSPTESEILETVSCSHPDCGVRFKVTREEAWASRGEFFCDSCLWEDNAEPWETKPIDWAGEPTVVIQFTDRALIRRGALASERIAAAPAKALELRNSLIARLVAGGESLEAAAARWGLSAEQVRKQPAVVEALRGRRGAARARAIELSAAGYSEREVTELMRSEGFAVTKSTIHRWLKPE